MPNRRPGLEANKLHEMTSLCACLNTRKAARLLTQWYDETLRPAGVRSTQLPLLAALGLRKALSMTELAGEVAMDRTTLTRNLGPLERKGWVQSSAGADNVSRQVSLTPRGWQVLVRAAPLWERAQADVANVIGGSRLKRLVSDLAVAIKKSQGFRRRKPL